MGFSSVIIGAYETVLMDTEVLAVFWMIQILG